MDKAIYSIRRLLCLLTLLTLALPMTLQSAHADDILLTLDDEGIVNFIEGTEDSRTVDYQFNGVDFFFGPHKAHAITVETWSGDHWDTVGKVEFRTANGDALYAAIQGVTRRVRDIKDRLFEGRFEILGGTGRFEGASGFGDTSTAFLLGDVYDPVEVHYSGFVSLP